MNAVAFSTRSIPWWLRVASVVLVVLLVIDIVTGRVLAWLILAGLIYIGCLVYAQRKGVFRDSRTERRPTERR